MNTKILTLSLLAPLVACNAQKPKTPNIIVIFTDDQGYNDLGCYGSELISTPNIDAMAADGVRFTDFYVSSSVSSASRAGLLTGKYNCHNGVSGVFWPGLDGMPSEQITIAEALKAEGYATACFGKWHLGDTEGHYPTDQGFDEYFGIPYSNDMFIAPHFTLAKDVVLREGYTPEMVKDEQHFADTSSLVVWDIGAKLEHRSPLMEGKEVIEFPCDQTTLTYRYFDRAMKFIEERNTSKPFFTYITPAMPHYPLFASEDFLGKSKRGLYGDAVEEIDYNVGRLMEYLEENDLLENTLIVFASDNGPWAQQGDEGGSAAPLRGSKFSLYEGGVRVPCIMRWDGMLPKSEVCESVTRSIDLFPTIMHYAKSEKSYEVDGMNIAEQLENPEMELNNEYLYLLYGNVKGLRSGNWVYLPEAGSGNGTEELYDLSKDISQSNNLIDTEVAVAEKMKARLEEMKAQL